MVLARPPLPSASAVEEEDGIPLKGAHAYENRDRARKKDISKAIGAGNMRRSKRVTG